MKISKLIEGAGKLGSLPAVVIRVNEALDNPKSTAAAIGKIINEDPALTAQLLKLVNSPFYGFRSRIDTVFRAVAIIGQEELRHLLLAAYAVKSFSNVSAELVDMTAYWRRSLSIAMLARVLASYAGERDIERYFIAGLLHDIGSLLLYQQLPLEASDIIRLSRTEGLWLQDVEKDMLGFDHAEAGAALLEAWQLPRVLVAAVQYHLEPEAAPATLQRAARIVNLAYELYHHEIERDPGLLDDDVVEPHWFEMLGISPDVQDQVLQQAKRHFEENQMLVLS